MSQGTSHSGHRTNTAQASQVRRAQEHKERADQKQRREQDRAVRGRHANQGGQATRRRGEALEDAILDATWELLLELGAVGLTFDAVASRASTSRSVVYRRWTTRDDLVEAAIIRRRGLMRPLATPDTGSLRGDLIEIMSENMAEYADLLSVVIAYVRDAGTSLAELRETILNDRNALTTPTILLRAQQRGEIDLTGVPPRVLNLPLELLRGHLLMTMRALSREEAASILDEIYFPLLRAYGALRTT